MFQPAWKVILVTHAETFLKGKSTPVTIIDSLDVWITPGNGNGNGQGRSVALDGGHTSQGWTDVIGKMCVNPP